MAKAQTQVNKVLFKIATFDFGLGNLVEKMLKMRK